MVAGSIYDHNNSLRPTFKNISGWNFDLASTDTVAINTAGNLSQYFNYDILNRSRGVGGAWDRGAYEATDGSVIPPPAGGGNTTGLNSDLVLNLDFNTDDLTSGIFKDQSTSANNADCQKSLTLTKGTWTATYNQCPASAVGPDNSVALAGWILLPHYPGTDLEK
jgi:uncharacterized protein YwbE